MLNCWILISYFAIYKNFKSNVKLKCQTFVNCFYVSNINITIYKYVQGRLIKSPKHIEIYLNGGIII